MAKITRYTGNFKAFAADATADNRTIFGNDAQSDTLDANLNTDFFSGWEILPVGAKPPREWFNGVQFAMTQVLAYLHQMGVSEWDSAQEFHIGSLTNKGSKLWVSQVDNNIGNDPEIDGGANWKAASLPDTPTNGLVARTAPFTTAARAIVAGDGLGGSNLDGISGNPSLNVDSSVARVNQNETITGTWSFNNSVGNLTANNLTATGSLTVGSGSAISQVLFASATINFGSVAAGNSATDTITVTGASIGDVVAVGLNGYTGSGIHVDSAQVSAANTVMVKVFNNSGSTLAGSGSTLKVFVFKN